jgi:hypothetical protein
VGLGLDPHHHHFRLHPAQPAAVGTYIGNAIDSIVIFFRSIGTSVNTV